jgi:Short C-terminal domain
MTTQPPGNEQLARLVDFMADSGWTLEARTEDSAVFVSSRTDRRVSLRVRPGPRIEQLSGDHLDLSAFRLADSPAMVGSSPESVNEVLGRVIAFMSGFGWTVEQQDGDLAEFVLSRSRRRVSLQVIPGGAVEQRAGDRLDLSALNSWLQRVERKALSGEIVSVMYTGSLVYQVGATYEGGHPEYLQKMSGNLSVRSTGVLFNGRNSLPVSISDVIGCELHPMQFGLVRSIFASRARALQVQLVMAHLMCLIKEQPYELRFHIHGSLTIPGESENARKFRDALYTLKPQFANLASPLLPQPSSGDIPRQIRQLDALRREGILTDEEFDQKKGELLSRM